MRRIAVIAALALAATLTMRAAYEPVVTFLAELARREPPPEVREVREDQADIAAATAGRIRARFEHHPKQRRFWQSTAKRLAALCTRRAGKSDGGVHEWLAKAITIPGWRAVYINTTKDEARKIVWRNDLGTGWLDLLGVYGEAITRARGTVYAIGGLIARVNLTTLTIDFSNGSQISLFGADDEGAVEKLLGQAKDEVWIDEAQKFPHLRKLIVKIASPLLKDKRGRVRLTGTPNQDCAGYFYDVTPEPDSGDAPMVGWEVHRWSVVDNPHFGRKLLRDAVWFVSATEGVDVAGPFELEAEADRAAEKERWGRTAGEALSENGWDGTEPDFLREWLGKWVKEDARYVYPVHGVPRHVLVFAPQRLTDNPIDPKHARWYDHELAVRDLPRNGNRLYEWMFAIGADFGYAETPCALTMWAFTFDRPDIFEMLSWKQHKVLPDDQRLYLELLWNVVPNIVALAGDPAGQKAADLEAWRTRFSLPIDDADKSAKNTWQTLMAGDIRKGNVHYRENSPLLHEHRHLIYLPTKPGKTRKDDEFRRIADGTVPGNDCSDGGLYAYRYMQHHLFRDKPKDPRTRLQKQGDEHEAHIDQLDELRAALRNQGEIDDYEAGGGYGY